MTLPMQLPLTCQSRRWPSGHRGAPSLPDTKPIYILSVDEPDGLSIVLIIRTSKDGITRATIALPAWHELPEGWDGPHEMHVAVSLADDYAQRIWLSGHRNRYREQPAWDHEWGELVKARS